MRNSRVLKFAPDGKLLLQWGTKGKGPGQFDLPHGIALDATGRVFVVDRRNERVQVFDSRGKYLSEWKGPPFVSPQDIAHRKQRHRIRHRYWGAGNTQTDPGVYVMKLDGSLLGRIGRRGNYDGQFIIAHGVAVGKGGEVTWPTFRPAGSEVRAWQRIREQHGRSGAHMASPCHWRSFLSIGSKHAIRSEEQRTRQS